MKLINTDSYLLSTGKEIHPNCGIIGLTEAKGLKIYEGYDGSWIVEGEVTDKECIELTNAEQKEIALYMRDLWDRFANELSERTETDGWNPHPETAPYKLDKKYKVRLNDEKGTETEDYFMGTHWHDYDYSEIGWWKEINNQGT